MTAPQTRRNDPHIKANDLRQGLQNARDALIDVKGKLKIFDVAPWPWLLDEIERAERILDRNAP